MKIQKSINQVDWKELKSFMHEDFVSRSWTEEENDAWMLSDDPDAWMLSDERWSKFSYYKSVIFDIDKDELLCTDIRTSIEARFKKELVMYLEDDPKNEIPILRKHIVDDSDGLFVMNWIDNFVWNYAFDEIHSIVDEYFPNHEDEDCYYTVYMPDFRDLLTKVEARKWRKEVYDLLIKFGLDDELEVTIDEDVLRRNLDDLNRARFEEMFSDEIKSLAVSNNS